MSTSLTISQIWVLHILFLPECIHRTILSYTYCKSHQPVNRLTLKHLCWRGENPWRTIFEKQLDLIESVSHPAKSKAFTININDTLLMTDKYLLNSFGRLKKATDIRMNKKYLIIKPLMSVLKELKSRQLFHQGELKIIFKLTKCIVQWLQKVLIWMIAIVHQCIFK